MGRSPDQNGDSRSDQTESPKTGGEARVREILRNVYDDVLAEPIPDSFAELLRKLGD